MNRLAFLLLVVLFSLIEIRAESTKWRIVGNLITSRTRQEAAYIGYSKILVFGGSTDEGITNTTEIVDFKENTIVQASPMKFPRSEFASLITPDSLVLAISGVTNGSDVTSTIEAYNPKNGKWINFGNLKYGRRQFSAVWISENEFMVIGGRISAEITFNSVEIFNITTKTSRQIMNYPVLTNNPSSGISSMGIPIVFGGREGGEGSKQTDTVYTFDTMQKKWISVGKMIRPSEFAPTIKLWDGRLAYCGGNNEVLRNKDWVKDIAIEENNSFKLIGTMDSGRHGHFFAQWNENTLLIGNGLVGVPFGTRSMYSTQWIDTKTGAVTAGPFTNHPHSFNSFLTIPIYRNGKPIASKIVVISGFGEGFKLKPSVEILEPKEPEDIPCDIGGIESHKLPNLYVPISQISLDRRTLTMSYPATLCPDNKLLIIQMQGAEVNSAGGDTYGKVTSYQDAGNYEFTRIEGITGNTITLKKPLTRTYNPKGKVQIIRVPEFQNYTLIDKLTCPKWNDSIYGVLALSVSDTLQLEQSIIADGAGFSGGKSVNAPITPQTHLDVYYGHEDSSKYALKGDGISSYLSAEHRSGKGAVANAGGGGNNHNAGGGGGANGGCGGQGGFGWDLMQDGDEKLSQGIGGYAADNTGNKIYMGGGGGAGHSNEGTGTDGGSGGGIIIIEARIILAYGEQISSKGNSVKTAQYDGAGGGGGGGTVLIKTNKIIGKLLIETYGGSGGGVTVHRDGPGGGGGGGVIGFSLPSSPMEAKLESRGGYGGKSRMTEDYGQADGCNGVTLTNVDIPGDNTILEGIEEYTPTNSESVSIYPLPADEIVTISSTIDLNATSCIVYDILGNQVGKGNLNHTGEWQINVSQLPSGVFFGVLNSDSGSKTVRVLVRH